MQSKARCLTVAGAITMLVGCSGGSTLPPDGGGPKDAGILKVFSVPSSTPVNGAFLVTLTGEGSATEGNAFPPAAGAGEPYFVDGWELKYEHVLATVDHIAVSEDPDKSATDPSQTGPVVAKADGPFAIDLAVPGPLESKEMNGTSFPLTRITGSFDATKKYAFGFDTVAATLSAQNVNLGDEAQAAYKKMVDAGQSLLLVGTATWKGTACRTTNAAYDFGRLPKAVKFSFGFKSPTTYKNCINPELSGPEARGIQVKTNAEAVAQVTLHLDHPFWDALEEDAPLRWDAIAARKSVVGGAGPATADVNELDLKAVDFQALKDAQGTPLPIRYCGPTLAGEATAGTLKYDPKTVPVSPAGGAAGLADLYEYMTYNQATFGHLNNDGLCFPARNYASPQ